MLLRYLLLLLSSSIETAAAAAAGPTDRKAKHQRDVLSNAHYHDFDPGAGKWLDIPGLDNHTAAADLDWNWTVWTDGRELIKAEVSALLGDAHFAHHFGSPTADEPTDETDTRPDPVPMYRDITGYFKGSWTRSNSISPAALPNSRHVSGRAGDVRIRLSERAPTSHHQTPVAVQPVEAEISISDPDRLGALTSWVDSYRFTAAGVQFPAWGGVILTTGTRPDSLLGPLSWPFLALSPAHFDDVRAHVNSTASLAATVPDRSETVTPAQCEYIIYLQLHPVTQTTLNAGQKPLHEAVAAVETSLRYSLDHSPPPPLQLSMVMLSPRSGTVLHSALSGLKPEQIHSLFRQHALIAAALLLFQLLILSHHHLDRISLSRLGRSSPTTVKIILTHHLLAGSTFILTSLASPATFHLSAVVAFFALSIFFNSGLPHLATVLDAAAVYRSRIRARTSPTAHSGLASTRSNPNPSPSPDSLPLFVPSDQAALSFPQTSSFGPSHAALQSYLHTTAPVAFFLSLGYLLCPVSLRPVFNLVCALVLSSPWVFQIANNAQYPSIDPAFGLWTALSLSLAWLAEMAYFLRVWNGSLWPGSTNTVFGLGPAVNLLDLIWLPPSSNLSFHSPLLNFSLLCTFTLCQILVLFVQHVFGARLILFFIPGLRPWLDRLPPIHDWCPLFYQDRTGQYGNIVDCGADSSVETVVPLPGHYHPTPSFQSRPAPSINHDDGPSSTVQEKERQRQAGKPPTRRLRVLSTVSAEPRSLQLGQTGTASPSSPCVVTLDGIGQRKFPCCICTLDVTIPVAVLVLSTPPLPSGHHSLDLSRTRLLNLLSGSNLDSDPSSQLRSFPLVAPSLSSILKYASAAAIVSILDWTTTSRLSITRIVFPIILERLPHRARARVTSSWYSFRLSCQARFVSASIGLDTTASTSHVLVRRPDEAKAVTTAFQHWLRVRAIDTLVWLTFAIESINAWTSRSFSISIPTTGTVGVVSALSSAIEYLYAFTFLSRSITGRQQHPINDEDDGGGDGDDDGDESGQESTKSIPTTFLDLASCAKPARYMITPCRHIFHTGCLISWMDMKLECPLCRSTLPPL